MLISTSAATFQKAGGQVCYFCDVTGKQTVLKQACYITESLTNEQTGTAQNKHSVISRSPKPCEDLQRPSLPGSQEEGDALAGCSWRALWYQGRRGFGGRDLLQHSLGCGCRPDQQFPISLHAVMMFWLPNWSIVPTLLLQAVYPWLERSAVRLIWGLFGSSPASSAPWPYSPT